MSFQPFTNRTQYRFRSPVSCLLLLAVFFVPSPLCCNWLVFAQEERSVVAMVNERAITLEEIDDTIFPQIFALKQQIHSQRKVALENLIIRLLLEDEARKRGISIENLKKQLTAGKIDVPAAQVDSEYSQNASAFGAMSPDEAKERIRLSIESQERIRLYQAALNELRKNSTIDIRLSEPRLPPIGGSGEAPTIGPEDATVTIVEFTDFQCPFCRHTQDVVKKILETYKQDVRLVFKHLPLDIHERALAAAKAAHCAGQQQSFWRYHDALFVSKDLSDELLMTIAARLRLDVSKFNACIGSEISLAAVLKDVRDAKRFGISGTPTFIINGKVVQGSVGFDQLKTIIDAELKHRSTTFLKPAPTGLRKD